jgi:hypothetical protein
VHESCLRSCKILIVEKLSLVKLRTMSEHWLKHHWLNIWRGIVLFSSFKINCLIYQLWFHAKSSCPRVFISKRRCSSLVHYKRKLTLKELIHIRENLLWHNWLKETRGLFHRFINFLNQYIPHVDYVLPLQNISSVYQRHIFNLSWLYR